MLGLVGYRLGQHSHLATRFIMLEGTIVRRYKITNDFLRELEGKILDYEAKEPPIKRYLNMICRNQVAISIGLDDVDKLRWWQRWFAQYLNGDGALQ